MMTTLRLAVFLFLSAASMLVAQNSNIFIDIQPRPVDPSMPLVVDFGKTVQFTATAYQTPDPSQPPVQVPLLNVQWYTDTPGIGSITQNGDFTAAGANAPTLVQRGMVIAAGDVGGMHLKAFVAVQIGNPPPPPVYDATISGVATGDGNTVLADVKITAIDITQPNSAVFTATTDPNGAYKIQLPYGSWVVSAFAPGYNTLYYDNASMFDKATKVVTDPSHTIVPGINFVFGHGGVISGRVIAAASGDPLAGGSVDVQIAHSTNPSILPVYSATTDPDGRYVISGLTAGTYIARAYAKGFAAQYFAGHNDYSSADTIDVVADTPVADINFKLDRSGTTNSTPYRITGTVRDEQGAPLASAIVVADNAITMPPVNQTFMAKSEADGSYVLNVPSGSFVVHADAQDHVGEYYDNAATAALATPVLVNPHDTLRAGIDFSLSAGGTITGIVRKASDNTPLAGASIVVISPSNSRPPANTVISGADGSYSIGGLPTGTYWVLARMNGFADQYFDHASDASTATDVAVTDGQVTSGIHFDLAMPPSISGTVKDAQGNPVPFTVVYAQSVPMTPTQPIHRYAAKTDPNGEYRIEAPQATYILLAEAQGFMPQWYPHASQPDSATQIVLGATDVTGIDFVLSGGGIITGKVLSSAGVPLQGVPVDVFPSKGSNTTNPLQNGVSFSNDSGVYAITGLATGSYLVVARAPGYGEQFYDKAPDASSATKVAVVDGQTTAGIDFELSSLPSISGIVYDESGTTPLGKAQVLLTGANTTSVAYTDQNGAYAIAVQPGAYKVAASTHGYATEWYNDKPDAATADDVVVSAAPVGGINFTLSPWGGGIAGIVRDDANAPLAKAIVKAWQTPDSLRPASNARPMFASTVTAADGSYNLQGLPEGRYFVTAASDGFLAQYYDNATSITAATPVQVRNSGTTTGIDFSLRPGGAISGTVTDAATNAPIANAFVSVRTSSATSKEAGARTDLNGVYHIDGLVGGEYIVTATAPKYAGQFYNGVTDISLATPVTVAAPGTVTGIDFSLALAPFHPLKYSGSVRDGNTGQPLSSTIVEGIDPSSGAIFLTTTDVNGAYEILSGAQCLVRARALGYVGLFAGGTQSWEVNAKSMSIGAADFNLLPASQSGFATLRGRVLDTQTKKAIGNAWVYGTDATGNRYFDYTGGDGGFMMGGLSTGPLSITLSGVQYAGTQVSATIEGASGETEINARKNDLTLATGKPQHPARLELGQNYPNPFNPSTSISFSLPMAGKVSLRVLNLIGQPVTTLLDGYRDAGAYAVEWNAANMPSGVYIYRLEANGTVITRRMTLLK